MGGEEEDPRTVSAYLPTFIPKPTAPQKAGIGYAQAGPAFSISGVILLFSSSIVGDMAGTLAAELACPLTRVFMPEEVAAACHCRGRSWC